ncbi:MAG: hypothetical protein R6V10_06490 [bacterium]
MEKNSFWIRTFRPAAIAFAVMTGSYLAYQYSSGINSAFLHQAVANISAVLLFFSIGFSVYVIYPLSFLGGGSLMERVVFSFLNPLAWATKEVFRVAQVFGLEEALYFYLNPLNLGLFFFVLGGMGLCELLCRRSSRKRGKEIKVFSLPAVAALLAGFSVAVFILAWGMGVHSFYIFQEGYKFLFR